MAAKGFSFDYAARLYTPLPPSWTMMLMGLVVFGFIAYRRQKKGAAAIAAA